MAELSGFEVLALIKEIDSTLQGSYINNIYTLGDAQLFRFRKQGRDDVWLVASPRLGMWVSGKVAEREATNDFTTKLRAGLERSRFMGASQADLDRVFELRFDEGDHAKKLILELMPPGNIILTDHEGRILLVKNEVKAASRRLVRGVAYSVPTVSRLSPSSVGPKEVLGMAKAEKTVGKAIGKHVALPRKYVSEALARLFLDEEAPSSLLEGTAVEVAEVLKMMVKEASEKPHPCVCETKQGDEIFVITPKNLKVKMKSETVSALCDDILLPEALRVAPGDRREDRERQELETTILNLKSEEASLHLEASKLRSRAAMAAEAMSTIDAEKIILDAGLVPRVSPTSPAAAASLLYDKAKELEERTSDIETTIARLSKKIPKVQTGNRNLTRRLTKRKQEWYEKFRWFFTSEGRLALGGRDAHSNGLLLKRYLQEDDVVYHADVFGSPFFVLKGGKAQAETEVREVAQATVSFSSAWKTGLGSADAYWVKPEQVSGAAPSGEYLAHGSFAIKGQKNYVTKNLVEVAVGFDTNGRVVSGPEAALMKRMNRYVVLKPQREKSSETAKRVLNDLQSSSEDQGLGPTVDDVLRALPTGGGKVVRRVDNQSVTRKRNGR